MTDNAAARTAVLASLADLLPVLLSPSGSVLAPDRMGTDLRFRHSLLKPDPSDREEYLLGHAPASADPKTNAQVAVKTLAALDDWGAALGASLTPGEKSSGTYLIPTLLHMRFSAQLDRILAQSTFHYPPLAGQVDRIPRISIILERTLQGQDEAKQKDSDSSPRVGGPNPSRHSDADEGTSSTRDPPAYLSWKLHAIRLPSEEQGWHPTETEALRAITPEVPTEEAITSAEDFWDGFNTDSETDRLGLTPTGPTGPEVDGHDEGRDDEYWGQYDSVETAAGDEPFLPTSPLPVSRQPPPTFLNLWSESEAGSVDLPPSARLSPAIHQTTSVTTFLSTSPRRQGDECEHQRGRRKATLSQAGEDSQVAALQGILRGTWDMFRSSCTDQDLDHCKRLFLETARGVLEEP